MKKIVLIFTTCLISVIMSAQNEVADKYGIGKVPVDESGKVTFVSSFPVNGKSQADYYKLVSSWAKGWFANPDVKKSTIKNDDGYDFTLRNQQILYFKKTAIVTDYAKISYTVNITVNETSCRIKMTDISYTYEDEREGGGNSFTAEEWITDDEAFNKNKTKLLKTTGKFRTKTIDLFNEMSTEVKQLLQ